MENNQQNQTTSGSVDVVKMALKEAVFDTTVPTDILIDFIAILEKYNVSTLLVRSNIEQVITQLIRPSGYQDALFDFMVEFRYKLLSHGMSDEFISKIVDSSVSIITRSTIANKDYKESLASISDATKKDILLCLIYLFRVNITYVAEMLNIKINKEKR